MFSRDNQSATNEISAISSVYSRCRLYCVTCLQCSVEISEAEQKFNEASTGSQRTSCISQGSAEAIIGDQVGRDESKRRLIGSRDGRVVEMCTDVIRGNQ